jgi:hypothetical protein
MDDDARGTRGDELEQRALLTALLATAQAAEGAASSEQQRALRLGRPDRAGEAESALRGAPRRRMGQEAAQGARAATGDGERAAKQHRNGPSCLTPCATAPSPPRADVAIREQEALADLHAVEEGVLATARADVRVRIAESAS